MRVDGARCRESYGPLDAIELTGSFEVSKLEDASFVNATFPGSFGVPRGRRRHVASAGTCTAPLGVHMSVAHTETWLKSGPRGQVRNHLNRESTLAAIQKASEKPKPKQSPVACPFSP